MDVQVNYLAVLLAGLSSMVIGTLYYADWAFGKQWKKLSGINVKEFEKKMPKLMPLMFLAALLTAYIVAHVMYLSQAFYGYSWLSTGITTALWLWLGISATTLFIHETMDLEPSKQTAISIGNRFLSLLAMGLILGWLHP
jgi:hypothetical protein